MEHTKEIWKNIYLEEYKNLYLVSNYGNIKSQKTGKIMKQHMRCAYKAINIMNSELNIKKTFTIHNLVANSFLEKPDNSAKYFINHKDGNKLNNKLYNLEFVTPSENVKHAIDNNLKKIYKLPVLQYDINNNFIAEYESIKQASIITKTSDTKISQVCKGNKESVNNFIWKYKYPTNINNNIDITNYKEIPEYPNYLITQDGKVFSKSHKKFLKLKKDGSGYMMINLYNNTIKKYALVHRLVAEIYIPKIQGKNIVNHKNKNKSDNRVENLEWVNESENMIHSNSS